MRGNCLIEQGGGYARSSEAVLWIDRSAVATQGVVKVIAYLESDAKSDVEVATDRGAEMPRLRDKTWFGRFFSVADVRVRGERSGKARRLRRRSTSAPWRDGTRPRAAAEGRTPFSRCNSRRRSRPALRQRCGPLPS